MHMHVIACKTCASTVQLDPSNPLPVHQALVCGCCVPDDPDHDHAVGPCQQGTPVHDGPCWTGPASGPKPDGCTICRPVVVNAVAGTALTSGEPTGRIEAIGPVFSGG
jgi:hypothetical protein